MLFRPIALAVFSASLLHTAQAAELDAAATLTGWQTSQTPRIAKLADTANALKNSVSSLCEKKTQANIDAARDAWRQNYLAWRAAEVLPLGPMLTRRTAWQIDVWPTKTDKVEEAVRLVQKDAAIADSVGAAAQGLPALEYLLWGDDRINAQLGRLAFKQRCDYALALASEIATETEALQQEWRSYRSSKLDADAARLAFEEAVNLYAASVETLRDKKLGRLGSAKLKQKPTRQDFDGWRSHSTRAGLQASLAALESLVFDPQAGGSFADRLLKVDKPILVQKLREEFAILRALLGKLPDDIATPLANDPRLAQPLLDSLKRLQGFVEFGIADAVGVTIGFKDKDGD